MFLLSFSNCTLFKCFRVAAEVLRGGYQTWVARYSSARANWCGFFLWFGWSDSLHFQIRESEKLQLCGVLVIRVSEWYLWFSASCLLSWCDAQPSSVSPVWFVLLFISQRASRRVLWRREVTEQPAPWLSNKDNTVNGGWILTNFLVQRGLFLSFFFFKLFRSFFFYRHPDFSITFLFQRNYLPRPSSSSPGIKSRIHFSSHTGTDL